MVRENVQLTPIQKSKRSVAYLLEMTDRTEELAIPS